MRFRPCIDIHNGKVKQIVGSSLQDQGDRACENYVSDRSAADYARLYQRDHLMGGHIILLNARDSDYFEQTRQEALAALAAYPGGLQIGGGITADNAGVYLDAGASHVIVTSYVFERGQVNYDRLRDLVETVGREHLVLDLSCRKRKGRYYVTTDRWQTLTEEPVEEKLLNHLADYCDEFLIHAADVEGMQTGPAEDLLKLLAGWKGIPVTYAGGIHSYGDIENIGRIGQGWVDFTVGSALDLFGGKLSYERVREYRMPSPDIPGRVPRGQGKGR